MEKSLKLNENSKKRNAKPPYKKPNIKERDIKLKKLKDLIKDGSITLNAYISKISSIYSFKPKRKYVEELEDTDQSDNTTNDEYTSDDDEYENETEDKSNTANLLNTVPSISNQDILTVADIEINYDENNGTMRYF